MIKACQTSRLINSNQYKIAPILRGVFIQAIYATPTESDGSTINYFYKHIAPTEQLDLNPFRGDNI